MSSGKYNMHEFAAARAVKLYLQAALATKLPVYRGDVFNAEVTFPCVFVQPEECVEPEELDGTATMDVTLVVGVKSSVDVAGERHEEACAEVMDLIFNDDLLTALNNGLVDYLVTQKVERGTRSTRVDSDDGIVTTGQRITLMCSMDGSEAN